MSSIDQEIEEKVSTGIPGLDEILNGGLPKSHIYLVEGNPGSGKTTLALQFLLAGVDKGEPGLFVTLSETKKELQLVARSHGWSLDKMALHELTAIENDALPEGHYTFFHPSEIELGETTKSLVKEVERVKPLRVVFDSLSEMRLLARDPLKYRRQILSLKQFFIGRECTVLLLDDLTSSAGDLQPQSLAHGVITLEQLAPDYGGERRRLRILKMRGMSFRGGYHDFTIETGGLNVFPRLEASKAKQGFKTEMISSGVPGIDDLLQGGIHRGSSTLIMGPAGSGKSSITFQYAIAAAKRGERSAVFAFEERMDTILTRCEGLGFELKKYVDQGLITIQQVNPAELSPGEFAHIVRQSAEKQKTQLVIIDSLNGYINAMPEERFLVLHLHELLSYLNKMSVSTFMVVAQHGLIGDNLDLTAGINISYIADTVVVLRYFETFGRVRKAVSIIKKRSGCHEDTIRELQMSSAGILVSPPLKEFQGVLTGVPKYFGNDATLIGDGFGSLK